MVDITQLETVVVHMAQTITSVKHHHSVLNVQVVQHPGTGASPQAK
ncbi:unnamed protein product [Schistosoma mattheei]|uniref:Uncharacterized protein n=1 Tax=Schistosoma mattheei TaxID=31246 RepID=A0A183Q3Z2_9TREM|nr:unnamed protein product [Schistosoma mattheei]